MNSISLPGCTSEPLINYLKGLGILRLISEDAKQGDPHARGAWKNGAFVLHTKLTPDELIEFFLKHYAPSPILAPWGARSGFYRTSSEAKARAALVKIARNRRAPRFARFVKGFRAVRRLLRELHISEKAKDEEKLALLSECRARLPDEMLQWLDACYVLMADERKFPPLFGTGGNEGSGSYVSGFAQQIVACLIEHAHDAALDVALFGGSAPRVASNQTPGHFSPPAAGGANASQGLEGNVTTNPWDYLLAIEGACLWASGVVRRFGQAGRQMAAFPFTVDVSGTGAGSLADSDGRRPKAAKRDIAEMWLPLWEHPVSLAEISALLSEGRATIGRRLAENGTDFARAAAGLGVDRGISAFQRVAFLMRNGQNFMGISLGRFELKARRHVHLLHETDRWLLNFRHICDEKEREDDRKKGAARFTRALRRIDRAIFDYCRYGGNSDGDPFFQAIVIALGNAERELATGESFRSKIRPLRLSRDWIVAAHDATPEFELALSLAGIYDALGKIGPVRANIEPVHWKKDCRDWAIKDRSVVWNSASLTVNLSAVLARRVMDGLRAGCERLPLAFSHGASLDSIACFLAGEVDENRLERLLWGLMLADQTHLDLPRAQVDDASPLPREFALLKLLFLPFPLRTQTGEVIIKPEPAILSLLRANRVGEPCQIAMRRLRVSGLAPLPHPSSGGIVRDNTWREQIPLDGHRLAAALLFPVSQSAISKLTDLVLRPEQPQPQTA
jgi:CRISPR-associated protein Csx17